MRSAILSFLRNEDGFFGAILGTALGSLIGGGSGKLLAGAIGGALGSRYDKRKAAQEDRRNATADYNRRRALGFTHSEIAGSGSGGAAGDTGQAVMGNQATRFEEQARAQAFEAEQKALDRLSQQTVANTQAQASMSNAATAANASMFSANTQYDIAALQNDREWQKMANAWANDNPETRLLFAQMSQGVENGVMFGIQEAVGLLPNQRRGISQEEFNRRFNLLMDQLAAYRGIPGMTNEGMRDAVQASQSILGSGAGAFNAGGINTPDMPRLGAPNAPR